MPCAAYPLYERTAKILLIMMQTAGGGTAYKCRQSDIAFALGISRMSTSKALQYLSGLGLVELGYGQIKVPNPERLTRWIKAQTEGKRS